MFRSLKVEDLSDGRPEKEKFSRKKLFVARQFQFDVPPKIQQTTKIAIRKI